jgi:hypothetical protein
MLRKSMVAKAHAVTSESCPFCDRTFARKDAARRHAKSCSARRGRTLPPPAKRGRPRRACDECSRAKVVCNGKQPCKRCSATGLYCFFRGHSQSPPDVQQRPGYGHKPFDFLLRCTDLRANLVNDGLVAGEPESGPRTTLTVATVDSLGGDNRADAAGIDDHVVVPGSDCIATETIDPQLLFLGLVDPYFDLSLNSNPPLGLPSSPDEALAAKIFLLKGDLEQVVVVEYGRQGLATDCSFDDFFTVSNFRHLITTFFGRRQLLARMIHVPTFDSGEVDSSLLLSVVLCGLAYSARTADNKRLSAALQDKAEKYVFKRLKQLQNVDKSAIALETCQAAYLITILQISRNDSTIRRRAVTRRQPALIDALRRLGILSESNTTARQTDWHAFVYRESAARLAAFAIFNDGLLALFCNNPPATTVSEMQSSLPCRDEPWEADSQETFEAEISKSGSNSQPSICMKDVLTTLLADTWDLTTGAISDALSVFDLYAVIGGKSNAPR